MGDSRFESVRTSIEKRREQVATREAAEVRQAAVREVETALAGGDAGLALGLLDVLDPADDHTVYLRACVLVQLEKLDEAELLIAGAPVGDSRFESVRTSIAERRHQMLESARAAAQWRAIRAVVGALAGGDSEAAIRLLEALDPDDDHTLFLRACMQVAADRRAEVSGRLDR